jgi:transposase-like protein
MAKVRMRKVSRYSNEFKITAIRLAGLSVTRIVSD